MSKRYTEQELAEVLRLHSAWLRGEPQGVRANLSGADLRRASLSWADLRWADLRMADLSRANLYNANLSGADLCMADLLDTNLYVCAAEGVQGIDIYVAQLGKDRLVYRGDTGEIQIGCQRHSVETWLDKGVDIGRTADWSMPDIDLYMSVISAIGKRRGIK